MIVPSDGTVLESTDLQNGGTFVRADPLDPVVPVSLIALSLAYGNGDYPDADEGEHPEPFGVGQHKYSVSITGDKGTLEDGYAGITVTTFCCVAIQRWVASLETAMGDDTPITRRAKMEDVAHELELDRLPE